jgi:hypothetical protein
MHVAEAKQKKKKKKKANVNHMSLRASECDAYHGRASFAMISHPERFQVFTAFVCLFPLPSWISKPWTAEVDCAQRIRTR